MWEWWLECRCLGWVLQGCGVRGAGGLDVALVLGVGVLVGVALLGAVPDDGAGRWVEPVGCAPGVDAVDGAGFGGAVDSCVGALGSG